MVAQVRLQGRYRLIRQIGQGGFGKTFLAVDEGQSPPVPCAIKQLSLPNQISEVSNQATTLFQQEAQLLKELGQHPQIPTLLAYFEQEQHLYLVQEYIHGTNLAQILQAEGAFAEAQIWQLLDDLLPVLKFIHDRQVIHRDLKPENIIRHHSDGRMVLVDFGAAKQMTGIEHLLQIDTCIGSPEYVAPEQVKGKATFASDLYSLGVTCIHLLTQMSPFNLFDTVNDCWAWRQYLLADVSQQLGQILDKLIENALSRRFQSVDEAMQAIALEAIVLSQESRRKGQKQQKMNPDEESETEKPPIFNPSSFILQTFPTFSLLAPERANTIAFCPPSHILASGHDDKTIKLWDFSTNTISAALYGHTLAVNSIAFSPTDQILASGSDDRTIKLWDMDQRQEIYTFYGHERTVKSVTFSSTGKLLASASWDKTVKLWNVDTATEICTLKGHQLQVTAVAFSPQGHLLASSSFDRTICLWKTPNTGEFAPYPYRRLHGHTWAVLAIAFSPQSQILASGSDDNTIKLWDMKTGQLIRTLLGHSWSVVALAFSSDGTMLLSGSWDKTVKLWQVETGAHLATLDGHLDSISAVAFSPRDRLIASSSKDRTIKLWQNPMSLPSSTSAKGGEG